MEGQLGKRSLGDVAHLAGDRLVVGGMWVGGAAIGFAVGAAAAANSEQYAPLDWLIRLDQLGLVLVLPSVVTTILAIAIVRAVNEQQARLVLIVADRTAVPTRPDRVHGDEGQNP